MARPDRESHRAAERRGWRSETLAALLPVLEGYRILGRPVRSYADEINLVAEASSGVICFVEVKARGARAHALAAEALGPRHQARIARAAELYRARKPGLATNAMRFDRVMLAPRSWPKHIRDAWRPETG